MYTRVFNYLLAINFFVSFHLIDEKAIVQSFIM